MTDFPVKFDQCPVCGSKRRIIEEEVAEAIKDGKLSEGSRVPAMMTQSIFYDPKRNMALLAKRQVPALIGFYDICLDCGNFYLVEMLRQMVVVAPQIQQQGSNQPKDGGRPWGTN